MLLCNTLKITLIQIRHIKRRITNFRYSKHKKQPIWILLLRTIHRWRWLLIAREHQIKTDFNLNRAQFGADNCAHGQLRNFRAGKHGQNSVKETIRRTPASRSIIRSGRSLPPSSKSQRAQARTNITRRHTINTSAQFPADRIRFRAAERYPPEKDTIFCVWKNFQHRRCIRCDFTTRQSVVSRFRNS